MERPILFSGEMIRAILSGRKTQTRRIIKPMSKRGLVTDILQFEEDGYWYFQDDYGDAHLSTGLCPYGKEKDRLWVRETFWEALRFSADQCGERYSQFTGEILGYAADGFRPGKLCCGKRPSIHMSRRASRIDLEITGVRVERLQDISEEDAAREGINQVVDCPGCENDDEEGCCVCDHTGRVKTGLIITNKMVFQNLWQSINGPESWAANPFVWVIEFTRVRP